MYYFNKHQVWEFVRFLLVGSSGVVVDFGIYVLLTRNSAWWATYFIGANIIATVAASLNNFCWNRYWTFKFFQGSVVTQYLRYVAVTAVYLSLMQLGLWFSVTILGWYDLVGKILTITVFVPGYFIVIKNWAFGLNNKSPIQFGTNPKVS